MFVLAGRVQGDCAARVRGDGASAGGRCEADDQTDGAGGTGPTQAALTGIFDHTHTHTHARTHTHTYIHTQ